MGLERTRIDYSREKRVLVNLVLNTQFCDKVLPVIKEEYFQARYAATLIKWVKEYHNTYGIAPKKHINELYEEFGSKMDPDDYTQMGNLLQHLSDVADTPVHNIDYLIDTADDLFKEKHLTLQNKAVDAYLEEGDLTSAENALNDHYKGIDGSSKNFIAFNDEDFIREVVRDMVKQDDDSESFFRFSGRLGDFVGPVNRGWFIAYLAPAKRGKTTYMLDSVIDSIMQRKNTLVISLEMPEKQLLQRYALAITGCKPEKEEYTVMIPTMDCKSNQTGECEKDERVGYGSVLTDGGLMPYEDNPEWLVCTACRGHKDFVPTSWKVPMTKPYVSEGDYVKKIKKFNRLFGKHGRIVHFPSKTATAQQLKDEVDLLRERENFIPDVIVLDYADLIKPEGSSGGEKRHQLDDIWEELRSWGQTNHVLIISASQTNRISADQEYIKDTHVAEDYSKIAKLDIAFGLCQNDDMKEGGIMNINIVAHRHHEYIQSHVCTMLQELNHQQSSLDSEFSVK